MPPRLPAELWQMIFDMVDKHWRHAHKRKFEAALAEIRTGQFYLVQNLCAPDVFAGESVEECASFFGCRFLTPHGLTLSRAQGVPPYTCWL